MRRTVLIDADVLLYRASIVNEKPVNWGDGLWTLWAHEEDAILTFDRSLQNLIEGLNATDAILALSSDKKNFRKSIYPEYKANRADSRKPIVYKALKEYCVENYETMEWDGLEGDDVLGILATSESYISGEKIIATIDKDLQTVPAKHVSLDDPDLNLWEVDEAESIRNHMVQTLSGDRTDNIPGCPGFGPKRSTEVIESPYRLISSVKEIKSGLNKGKRKEQWVLGDPCSMWQAVIDRFVSAGLTENDALTNARLTRILQAQDVEIETGYPKLWQPVSDHLLEV